MRHACLALLLSVFFASAPLAQAYALEDFVFNNKLGASTRLLLSDYLHKEFKKSLIEYEVASADLNGDQIEEYIARNSDCRVNQSSCQYLFFAQKEDRLLLLSRIRARYVMLGEGTTHGIRDLLAFRSHLNDYEYDTYSWDVEVGDYILTKREMSE